MKRRSLLAAACLAAVGFVVPIARAGECVVGSTPVPPFDLATALEFGTAGSLPGQLAGVPFSVVSLEQLSLTWLGCDEDCFVLQFDGVSECGDLTGDPVVASYLGLYPGAVDPSLVSNVSARQGANGRWVASAQAFVSDATAPESASATYVFELGTRDVIDLTSNGGPDPLPLEIGIRAGTWVEAAACEDGLFRWNALRDLRFRVTEQPVAGPQRTLVDTVYYDQFVTVDDVFPVETTPDSALTVDVYLRIVANATGAQDPFGAFCAGATAFLDMDPRIAFVGQSGGIPAYDGIQVLFSPDPALGFAPRSGIAYAPVPEPDALASGGGALVALAACEARRRARHVTS